MILGHLQVKQNTDMDGGTTYSLQTTLFPDDGVCQIQDLSETYIAFKRGTGHLEMAKGYRNMADWLEKL